jgi:hypothetical protein
MCEPYLEVCFHAQQAHCSVLVSSPFLVYNALQALSTGRCHSQLHVARSTGTCSSGRPLLPMQSSGSSSSSRHCLQPRMLQRSQCSPAQPPSGRLRALPVARQQQQLVAQTRQQPLPSSSSTGSSSSLASSLQPQRQQQQQCSVRPRLPPLCATFAAGGDDGLVDPKPQVSCSSSFRCNCTVCGAACSQYAQDTDSARQPVLCLLLLHSDQVQPPLRMSNPCCNCAW